MPPARILSPKPLPDGHDEWIDVAVDPEAQRQAAARLSNTVRLLRTRLHNGDFPISGARKGKCRRCDFRTFCPGYDAFIAHGGAAAAGTPAEDEEHQTDLLADDTDAGSTSK